SSSLRLSFPTRRSSDLAADAWRTGECPPRSRSVVSGPAGAVILRWVASCASVEFGVLPPDRARQRTIVGHELDDRVSELFQRQRSEEHTSELQSRFDLV